MLASCAVCGNDIPVAGELCPYCGTARQAVFVAAGPPVRTLNLKAGMPDVATAMTRFAAVLERERQEGAAVLVVIHGYGASGTGGAIREALRRQLGVFQEDGRIRRWIIGEEFSKNDNSVRDLMRRYPSLARDRSLTGNCGLTIVVL